MAAGLVLGLPSLVRIHWSWEIVAHGATAGLLMVVASVLYYTAQGPLKLPKRLAGAMAANGPALSGLVGLFMLNQSLGLVSLAGILTILVASLLNATLTGSEAERAAETVRYTYKIPGKPDAQSRKLNLSAPSRTSTPRRAQRRPPSWQAHTRKTKARARARKR